MRKTRGGWGETFSPFFPPPPPPFPSRARLNFAFNTFPLRILSESLAQANQQCCCEDVLFSGGSRPSDKGKGGMGGGGSLKNFLRPFGLKISGGPGLPVDSPESPLLLCTQQREKHCDTFA